MDPVADHCVTSSRKLDTSDLDNPAGWPDTFTRERPVTVSLQVCDKPGAGGAAVWSVLHVDMIRW